MTTTLAPSTRTGSAAPPFALVVGVTLIAISAYALVPPVLPDIVAAFGISASVTGLVLAATTIPGIVLAPVVGAVADRYGRREILAACLLAFGLGGGLCVLAPGFGALVGLRLLQGVGAAGLINLVIAIIGDAYEGAERARMMGRNAAALTVAVVAFPPLGGALAGVGGWRLAFAPYWLGVLAAAAVLRWVPKAAAADRPVTAQMREAARALRAPAVRGWLWLGAIAFLLLFGLVLTVTPVYLAERFALAAGHRGLVLALPALLSAAAALSLGRLSARFASRTLIAAGFAVWAGAFALVAAVPALPAVTAALLVYGLGEGLIVPTLQNAAAGAGPATSRATVVAVFVACTRAGQTAGPLLAAPLLAGPGARSAFALGAAGAALAGLVQSSRIRSSRRTA
jgi:MFS family permease